MSMFYAVRRYFSSLLKKQCFSCSLINYAFLEKKNVIWYNAPILTVKKKSSTGSNLMTIFFPTYMLSLLLMVVTYIHLDDMNIVKKHRQFSTTSKSKWFCSRAVKLNLLIKYYTSKANEYFILTPLRWRRSLRN